MVAYWWPGEKGLFAGVVSERRPDISAAGANRPEDNFAGITSVKSFFQKGVGILNSETAGVFAYEIEYQRLCAVRKSRRYIYGEENKMGTSRGRLDC